MREEGFLPYVPFIIYKRKTHPNLFYAKPGDVNKNTCTFSIAIIGFISNKYCSKSHTIISQNLDQRIS